MAIYSVWNNKGGVGKSYELVFVNDASPDDSWSALAELAAEDEAVKAFQLSRNFGEEAALLVGLANSDARWTVVMDCDLQDLPEDIPRLYAKALEGYEIVFTKRKHRGHSHFRAAGSRLYFKRAVTDKDQEPDPDLRVLEVMKSNYGPIGETINLRWKDGLFQPRQPWQS